MANVHVINAIEVPKGMESVAEEVRDRYVDYFRQQDGFCGSTFYRARDVGSSFHYVNIVIWESQEAFERVVNLGFKNADGRNEDGMKVLGRGFPAPIVVHPGRYTVIRDEGSEKSEP